MHALPGLVTQPSVSPFQSMVHDIAVSNSHGGVVTTKKLEAVLKCYRELGPSHTAVLAKLQLFSRDDVGNVRLTDLKHGD